MESISPTPYPSVNEILVLLLRNVKEIVQDQFIGMYLFGSLANGDFDEHSDIDVLVVTEAEITRACFLALQNLHEMINRLHSPWAIQIEASYIPRTALRRFDPARKLHPHMDRGNGETLHMLSHESDWVIQRHILRERGVVMIGPSLKTLIDPVSPNDLRKAVVDVLPLWANPILGDPSQISKRGYQSYFVLSLCRMLYTLKHGKVLSKPAAADWAIDTLDSRWKPLIERALIGRQNPNQDASVEDIDETLQLIRYTLESSRTIQNPI